MYWIELQTLQLQPWIAHTKPSVLASRSPRGDAWQSRSSTAPASWQLLLLKYYHDGPSVVYKKDDDGLNQSIGCGYCEEGIEMKRVESGFDSFAKKGGGCQLNDAMEGVGTKM